VGEKRGNPRIIDRNTYLCYLMDSHKDLLNRFDAFEKEFESRPPLNLAKRTTITAKDQALLGGIDAQLDAALAKPRLPKCMLTVA
jgi:hypothetical protein